MSGWPSGLRYRIQVSTFPDRNPQVSLEITIWSRNFTFKDKTNGKCQRKYELIPVCCCCSVKSDSLWPDYLPTPVSMEFSRQESCSGLPFPPPGDLPDPGIEPVSPALRAGFYQWATAAAKSLQSCLTLCNPINSSPPGSPFPGILQARTLEWVAISFSNACKWKVKVKSLSHVRLFTTPWTAVKMLLLPKLI